MREFGKHEKSPIPFLHRAEQEDSCEDTLTPDRIILGVAIRAPRCDEMDYPAKKADRSDPRNTGQNQPQNADQYSAVVNLTNARNQKTQYSGDQGFTHCSNLPPQSINESETDLLQEIFDSSETGHGQPINSCTRKCIPKNRATPANTDNETSGFLPP